MRAMGLREDGIKDHHRVCSRHFPNADPRNKPELSLGKRFASPRKQWTSRAKRAKARESSSRSLTLQMSASHQSHSSTPENLSVPSTPEPQETPIGTPLVAADGEELDSDYMVHELPSHDTISESGSSTLMSASMCVMQDESSQVLVSTALLARIEALESENLKLKEEISSIASQTRNFTINSIAADNKLVKLYTGFPSYEIFLAFYEFLGPAVDELMYWGEKEFTRKRQRKRKLSSVDQLLLTLMKLKLNLRNKDLGFRFSISESLVSRCLSTWVCFLYRHLKEINWTPSTEQVAATLPHVFREKYPTTFAIIDGSEIFIETPNDLHLQSSTWSSYKHHNTAKFLIGCTPNGAVSFISPLYVGSISDVELTRVSGFLQTLEGKGGISVMADRGFTISDQLSEIGVDLNIPPFLEGRSQLPSDEVKKGRGIASLRIHVERVIGRIKQFSILKGRFPLSMARLLNQVVCVCAWLTNFHPALISPPVEPSDSDIEEYLRLLGDSDSDCSSCDSD